MKLIIGLGNPGQKYEKTRHNLGFRALEKLKESLGFEDWNPAKKFKSLISEGHFNEQKIILAKPQTFMNNSGQAVKPLIENFKLEIENLLIIHDDIDLPLGEIRIQKGRGSAGHKGVQSIIEMLGAKDFTRIRIGIRPKNEKRKLDTEKFVLEKFTDEEEEIIEKTIKKAVEIIFRQLL